MKRRAPGRVSSMEKAMGREGAWPAWLESDMGAPGGDGVRRGRAWGVW